MEWLRAEEQNSQSDLSLLKEVSMVQVINFLGSRKKASGSVISYGYFRLFRSTVVKSLKLMGNRSLGETDRLDALAESIKAENPNGAGYDDTFDLDNVLRGSEKADRDRLRKTVIITLK